MLDLYTVKPVMEPLHVFMFIITEESRAKVKK
jgi:hypothetical protein